MRFRKFSARHHTSLQSTAKEHLAIEQAIVMIDMNVEAIIKEGLSG